MIKKKLISYEAKKQWYGYLFIAPWIIGVAFLFFRPLAGSVIYSVNDIKLDNEVILNFAGIKYYMQAFVKDANYPVHLTTSLSNMLYEVPLVMVFSLVVAYVLNSRFIGSSFFKSLFFLPVIISSGVVISIIRGDAYVQLMNNTETTSALFRTTSMATLLINSGISPKITDFIISAASNIFNLSWKSGIQILLFISAFKSIPNSLMEAASIEGATSWESFWKITFPIISPTLLTNITYTIVDTFTDYSNPVITYIAEESAKLNISFSAAMSFAYFIIIFSIMMIVYALINRHVFYYAD